MDTILGAYRALAPGRTLRVTFDHDLSCMFYTLQATEPRTPSRVPQHQGFWRRDDDGAATGSTRRSHPHRPQADRDPPHRQPASRGERLPVRDGYRPRAFHERDTRSSDLAYREHITRELPRDEILGDAISRQLVYLPTVTREPFARQGRITELLDSGQLARELAMPVLDPETDRVMICGSPAMLRDLKRACEARGFEEGNSGQPGDFVVERAFAET